MNKKKKAQTRTSKNDQSSLNCASNQRNFITKKPTWNINQCIKDLYALKEKNHRKFQVSANTNLSIFSMK